MTLPESTDWVQVPSPDSDVDDESYETSRPQSLTSSLASLASSSLMFSLTKDKLERATQRSMSGARGAPGLRELVLLSNAMGNILSTSQTLPRESSSDQPPTAVDLSASRIDLSSPMDSSPTHIELAMSSFDDDGPMLPFADDAEAFAPVDPELAHKQRLLKEERDRQEQEFFDAFFEEMVAQEQLIQTEGTPEPPESLYTCAPHFATLHASEMRSVPVDIPAKDLFAEFEELHLTTGSQKRGLLSVRPVEDPGLSFSLSSSTSSLSSSLTSFASYSASWPPIELDSPFNMILTDPLHLDSVDGLPSKYARHMH